jgi:hypothetical protein
MTSLRPVRGSLRLLLIILAGTILSIHAFAQQAAPQRDPQGLQLLYQLYLKMGSANIAQIVDVQAVGQVYDPNDLSNPKGTFVAKLRGRDFSMDTTRSDIQTRYRVLNGIGSVNKNGEIKPLAPYNSAGLSLDILPLFARWTEFVQRKVAVMAPKDVQVDGVACYSIHVDLGDAGSLNDHGKVDVLLDRASGFVLAIRYLATLGPYKNFKTLVENHFADYADFGGIMLPRRVTRYVNGQPIAVLMIDQVRANNGFTDADFRN